MLAYGDEDPLYLSCKINWETYFNCLDISEFYFLRYVFSSANEDTYTLNGREFTFFCSSIQAPLPSQSYLYTSRWSSAEYSIIMKRFISFLKFIFRENQQPFFLNMMTITSVIDLGRLEKFIRSLPPLRIYGGYPLIFFNTRLKTTFTGVSGAHVLYSSDILLELLYRLSSVSELGYPDDVIISSLLSEIPRTVIPRVNIGVKHAAQVEIVNELSNFTKERSNGHFCFRVNSLKHAKNLPGGRLYSDIALHSLMIREIIGSPNKGRENPPFNFPAEFVELDDCNRIVPGNVSVLSQTDSAVLGW